MNIRRVFACKRKQKSGQLSMLRRMDGCWKLRPRTWTCGKTGLLLDNWAECTDSGVGFGYANQNKNIRLCLPDVIGNLMLPSSTSQEHIYLCALIAMSSTIKYRYSGCDSGVNSSNQQQQSVEFPYEAGRSATVWAPAGLVSDLGAAVHQNHSRPPARSQLLPYRCRDSSTGVAWYLPFRTRNCHFVIGMPECYSAFVVIIFSQRITMSW